MDFQTFSSDRRTVLAVIRSFEIMGEAARNVPAGVRQRYSQVPWQDLVAMRNKLIHECFGVDVEVLWRTIQDDLTPLSRDIRQMLGKPE